MNEKPVLCYFGHPKSGSTWLGGIFGRAALEMGKSLLYKQLALENTVEELNAGEFDFLISQNTSYGHIERIKRPYLGFHVIRDPRDIVVSSYFSYKKTHAIREWSQLQEVRNTLNSISFNEGLLEIMDFNRTFFKHMSGWNFNDPNIYEIKFEELIDNSDTKLREIFIHLNILDATARGNRFVGLYNRAINKFGLNSWTIEQETLSGAAFDHILATLSFQNLSKGRSRGVSNENSHYRKGKSGDWKQHFTDQHKDYFKEHFGTLLIELGYEKDLNW